jgi:ferredoxin
MLTLTPEGIRFDRERCCQCGVCLSSCPVDALSSAPPDGEGVSCIVCDANRCIRCGRCVQVCPAHELPTDTVDEAQIRAAPGRYVAFAADADVRWMASSGGVARALVAQALQAGVVDAVYTLTYPEDPTAPSPAAHARRQVLPTGQEVAGGWWTAPPPRERVPGSIYRPVLWGRELGTLAPAWKRVLLVGLPCQLKGAKTLLAILRPGLDVLSMAILCRQQKTLSYTRRIFKFLRIDNSGQVPRTTYRGEGWPGLIRCGSQPGAPSMPFLDTAFAFSRELWTLPACDYCASPCGAHAVDLCIADPWFLVAPGMDPHGSSVVYAWTPAGRDWLESARDQVRWQALSADDAVTVMDIGRIRRKIDGIRRRMGTLPATREFLCQERARTRQEKIFWHIHPDNRLWKGYAATVWYLQSALLFLPRACKQWLRSRSAKAK